MSVYIKEFIGKNITLFLKSGVRFSGRLVAVDDDFLKFDDRFKGVKIIALDTIENLEGWNGQA